jgi:hypothetical protein
MQSIRHTRSTVFSKGFEPALSLAPTQRARASPAAVAAAGQVAQKANQVGARALRAMYVRATVQCHECHKLHAVYNEQPLHKLEKLHAGCRAVVPDDNGSDSDGNACIHGMLMVRQQLVLRAMHQNPRSRKHKALARRTSTQHGDVRSVQQPRQLALAWFKTQQTLTRHSQHPSLMSRRTMQTRLHMQILSRMQLLRRMQVQTREQTQVLVRTCHLAALASASVAVHA